MTTLSSISIAWMDEIGLVIMEQRFAVSGNAGTVPPSAPRTLPSAYSPLSRGVEASENRNVRIRQTRNALPLLIR